MSLVSIRKTSIARLAFLTILLTPCLDTHAKSPTASRVAKHRQLVTNQSPLAETPLVRLPIGSVKPSGWLETQLKLQAKGLTGASEQLYDALKDNSGWLGGDGESWERSPYYVKGLIALAYTLDDPVLKQRAQRWIDWTLQSQNSDGFFGPTSNNDWWPRMVALFYLRDYYEATGDDRVIPFLSRYFRHQIRALPQRPLRDWGRARAGDNMDVVLWTYNLTGEDFLLELAELLGKQAYPWPSIYTDNQFYDFGSDFHPHHIVNVSQALKMPALLWQVNRDRTTRDAFRAGVDHLERQYGRVDGQVSGTEMLSGRSSTDGVELCADVERILSNAIALTILGDADLGDQIEKVAYNSFPAHTTSDLQQITYYQFPNQVACTNGPHGFTQDYTNVNMPGPYSGFPCCCYNWHFGWPKLVQHMWAATKDGGLALMVYGPNEVRTTVQDDVPIKIGQVTDYPFKETVNLNVDPAHSVEFPLLLRIPGWCDAPRVSVNGESVSGAKAGKFYRLERIWNPGDQIEMIFPMEVRTSEWVNQSVALERGPLAYSLKIKEQWKLFKDHPGDFDEYEIRPNSPWNYALRINREAPDVKVVTRPISSEPFATDAAPVVLRVPAQRVPSWKMRTQPGRVQIGRADGGWNPIQSSNVVLEPSKPHRVRIEYRSGRLSIRINDQQEPVISRTDLQLQGTGFGLRAYQTTAKFQDIQFNGQPISGFSGRDLGAWTTHGGEWSVDGKQVKVAANPSGKAIAKGLAIDGDFTLQATITIDAGGDAGLIFGVKDIGEEVDAYQGYYVGLTCVSGKSEDSEEPPTSPLKLNTPIETVELIPFGSTRIRVSYFPVVDLDDSGS